MDIVIIIFGYILAIILFCGLIRLRLKKEETNRNYIYVLVVSIILLLVIWGVFRNFWNK